MAGIKLGNRVLAVGMRDPGLIAAIAVKAGLTGRACAYDSDPARVRSAAAAIEREGALAEAVHAPWGALPYEAGSFDVAVARDVLMTLTPDDRAGCLAEVRRVLRHGGRILVIETARRRGLGALMGRTAVNAEYVSSGGALAALQAAGFAGARILAERDGVLYAEAAQRG